MIKDLGECKIQTTEKLAIVTYKTTIKFNFSTW